MAASTKAAADRMGLDHEFLIRWALSGLAKGVQEAGKTRMDHLRDVLENTFLGAGDSFAKILAEQKRLTSQPQGRT